MSKKQNLIKEKNREQVRALVGDPVRYMEFHEDYNVMLNLIFMLTQTTDDLEAQATCIFYGDSHAYKDYSKASYAALESMRKDKMLFNDNNLYLGNSEYEKAIECAQRLRQLLKLIMAILNASDQEGFTKIDTALKLIYTPDMQRHNLKESVDGVVSKHNDDAELISKWLEYSNKVLSYEQARE